MMLTRFCGGHSESTSYLSPDVEADYGLARFSMMRPYRPEKLNWVKSSKVLNCQKDHKWDAGCPLTTRGFILKY